MTGGSGLFYDRYHSNGFDEWLTRIGDAAAPPILIVPPFFEELNRTRALVLAVMRDLARRGFGCWLPDLPGTGESARALETCSWDDWRKAVRDAAARIERAPLVAALRGGCLLDDATHGLGHWRFAPVEGASLARDLARSGLMTAGGSAGYDLAEALATDLRAARPAALTPLRTVRLTADLAEADARIDGPALWRRSEPGHAPDLAAALAADIANWSRQCGIC